MRKLFSLPLLFLTLFILSNCSTTPPAPQWMVYSNRLAEEITRDYASLYPELGSSFGYREYDKLGQNPSRELHEKYEAIVVKWIDRLEVELNKTKDKNLIVDLKILLDNVKRTRESLRIDEKLGAIPVIHASQNIYGSLFQLINDQSSSQRKKDAVDRFKFYMSEESGKLNLVAAYRSEMERLQKKYKKHFYPFKGEIEKYLMDSPFFVKGVGELLSQSGRDDWKEEYQNFKAAIDLYDNFLKNTILPKTRNTPMLPKDVYKLQLKSMGVDRDPKELIKIGKVEFEKLYKEYKRLAKNIAADNNLQSNDPAYVINFLKTKQVTRPEEVEALYHKASERLTQIITTHNLITLPKTELKIRMASDAESKASPVPHLNPPPLIDNDGIRPEFVVPTSSTGEVPFNDFSYENAAIILTAHEGRPGHDLQFTRMIENPPSIIRARYAFNSVNVEGWALYAEDLVYPYLTTEEQFAALQSRLWRQARYFLDPMVQLGKGGISDVLKVFTKRLGVSQTMATLEFQRYAFRSPGQATAYFHGYRKILDIKQKLSSEFGNMNMKCFNDTLISFGLLPHSDILLFKDDFKKCVK